jgi:glycosyltransferase involved in cell wall biosynthesis
LATFGIQRLVRENNRNFINIKMDTFTIGITTFSKRYDYLEKLVFQIREHANHTILLAINGDYQEKFNEDYRKQILNLSLKHENVFPIFFPEQRGTSKLLNTLIIHSQTNWILILNDDIEILSGDVFSVGDNLQNLPDIHRINESFSHFFIHKSCIDELGYFEERFLGFGEEDGDIVFRYIEKYNKWIKDFYIHGLNNLVSDIRDEKIKPGIGKYSAFNRNFAFNDENCKYIPDANGINGMFGFPMKKNLQDLNQYPYEKFFQENKEKL